MENRELKFKYTIVRENGYVFTSPELSIRDIELGNAERWLEINSAGDISKVLKRRQFIGIKDITDKELYEGDILKVGENLVCEIVYIENNVEDYGDEIHSAFHAKVYRHNKIIPLDSYLKNNCVKIGDIYENPELLNIGA